MASLNIKNKDLKALLKKDGPFPFEFAQQGLQPVYSVDHVHFTFLAVNRARLVLITAFGLVTTTGWTQAHLQPFIYIQPPPDGIWDFVFAAKPPSGIAADVITPVSTTYVWKLGSSELRGVRVHSATNTIVQRIADEPRRVAALRLRYDIGEAA